jgi:hypothetical protein
MLSDSEPFLSPAVESTGNRAAPVEPTAEDGSTSPEWQSGELQFA